MRCDLCVAFCNTSMRFLICATNCDIISRLSEEAANLRSSKWKGRDKEKGTTTMNTEESPKTTHLATSRLRRVLRQIEELPDEALDEIVGYVRTRMEKRALRKLATANAERVRQA